MTFGQKLKKLRNDNGLTQEQLAESIFVSRTAVSKWETGNGYPSIDSLKQLSILFKISIDELISDADVENKKLLDEKKAKKMYFIAIAFFGLAVLFTLSAYFMKLPYWIAVGFACVIGYLIFGFLAKPRYKRIQARKKLLPYILSRIVIFSVLIGAMIYTAVSLFCGI